MLKKLAKLLALYRATKHGHRHSSSYGSASYKPWKRKKWKGYRHEPYGGGYGYQPYGPPHGYDRPRGFKAMIIDLIVRKLLKQH